MDSYGISESLSQGRAMTQRLELQNQEVRQRKKDLTHAGLLQAEQDQGKVEGDDQTNLIKTGLQTYLAEGKLEGLSTLPVLRGFVNTTEEIGADGKLKTIPIPKGESWIQSQKRLVQSRNPTATKVYNYVKGNAKVNTGGAPVEAPTGSGAGGSTEGAGAENPLSRGSTIPEATDPHASVEIDQPRPSNVTNVDELRDASRISVAGGRGIGDEPRTTLTSSEAFGEGAPADLRDVAVPVTQETSELASAGGEALEDAKDVAKIGVKDVAKGAMGVGMKVAGNIQGASDIYDFVSNGFKFDNKNSAENWGEALTSLGTVSETIGLAFPMFEGVGALLQVAGGIATAVGEHDENVDNKNDNAQNNQNSIDQQKEFVGSSLQSQGQIANQSQHISRNAGVATF
jgi:hypothetical protein